VDATTGSTAGSSSNFMAVWPPGEELIGQVGVCERPGELQLPSINPKSVSASVRAASAPAGSRRDAMSSMTSMLAVVHE
jgi:hypothetical protein